MNFCFLHNLIIFYKLIAEFELIIQNDYGIIIDNNINIKKLDINKEDYEIKELNVFRITNEDYTSPLVDFSLIEICNTYNNKITFGLFDDGCSQHYIIEGYSEIVSAVKEWEIFKEKMKFEYNDEKDIIYSYDSIGLKV